LQLYNTDVMRSQLGEHATPDNPNLAATLPSIDLDTGSGQAVMSGIVERQAAMVAYVDSFHMLFVMCLIIIPFIFLLRTKRASNA
jgi:DHA2 family multidrug resistance protein